MAHRELRKAIERLAKCETKRDIGRNKAEALELLDKLIIEYDQKNNRTVPNALFDALEQLHSSIGVSTLFKKRQYYVRDTEQFSRAYNKLRELIPVLPPIEL